MFAGNGNGSPQRLSSMKYFTGLILLALFVGCTSTLDALLPADETTAEQFAEESRRRQDYLETRKADDIRWLLRNRVKNGMSKSDLDRILGESGRREFDDSHILNEEGLYRSDDIVYRWGPDSDGNVYLFVFRDHHLINFENFSEEWEQALE